MTQMIRLTRGLPASGKSTYAQALIRTPDWVRVERDLLRDQLFGTRYGLSSDQENVITAMQTAMAAAALKAGKSIVISDMNLRASYVRQWAKFATRHNAVFNTVEFYAPIDVLIERDAQRINSVGAKVIRELAAKFTKNGVISKVDVSRDIYTDGHLLRYVPKAGTPGAIMVDLDGTLAKMEGRSPYEWMRVGEDKPIPAVIDAVVSAYRSGKKIIFMSGRDSVCREVTFNWLVEHVPVPVKLLFMRVENDNRPDNLVKYDLFNAHVRDNYNVQYVLDDRNQVVDMWRAIGLPCFQVAPGEF